MKVYLAGGTEKAWRRNLEERWSDHELVDPFRDSRQGAIMEFTLDDLDHIRTSGLVFGYCNYHVFDGMASEFGFAYALRVPIVMVVGEKMKRVPSMMAAMSSAVFTDMHEAASFAERRYLR